VRWSGGAWSAIVGAGDVGQALGVSPEGEIVGAAGTGASVATGGRFEPMRMRGFLFSNALQALPLPDGRNSAVYARLAGRSVGIVENDQRETHGFVIRDGVLTDVGTLGGATSAVYALNRAGDVVGASETSSGPGRAQAFYLPASGAMTPISIDGATGSDARGIDDKGRVAVNWIDAKGTEHAAIVVPGKNPIDLTPTDDAKRPWVSAHVAAMTPDGRAIGWGVPALSRDAVAPIHCVLWTAPSE
jgi:uncharacterized membrane protein